jgi:hypothetical protein
MLNFPNKNKGGKIFPFNTLKAHRGSISAAPLPEHWPDFKNGTFNSSAFRILA